MTTIATDGKTIAADGLVCAGDEPIDRKARKILVGRGPSGGPAIYAFSGRLALFGPAVAWIMEGAKPADVPCPEQEWMLLKITQDGMWSYRHDCPYAQHYANRVQAFGSGENYAMSAMRCGKSPREAVEIAAELNVHTGGEIMVIDIAEALAEPTVVPFRAQG